ncbi:MAG TPA: hypothetical protein VMQ61_10805 [Thermoanaerobaculia bacterium]|nr:hypothetical protein [Thermoanaerobaculia bacterium]
MKGYARLAAATLLLAAAAVSAEPQTSAKNHAKTLTGTVATVDPGGKSLTVRDAKGRETTVVLTGATRVTGGKLEKGEKVTVRWMVREKQSVATVVMIQTPEPSATASASNTAPAPASPTPKSR